MEAAKSRLRELRSDRERVARQLQQASRQLPKVEELMPRLRERLRDLEATLKADLPRGRMALGALLGDRRIRVYRDGRLEGLATLEPETELPAERVSSRPGASVVAGEGFEPPTSGL